MSVCVCILYARTTVVDLLYEMSFCQSLCRYQLLFTVEHFHLFIMHGQKPNRVNKSVSTVQVCDVFCCCCCCVCYMIRPSAHLLYRDHFVKGSSCDCVCVMPNAFALVFFCALLWCARFKKEQETFGQNECVIYEICLSMILLNEFILCIGH